MVFFSILISAYLTPAHAFTLNVTDPYIVGWETEDLAFNINYENCTLPEDELNAAIDDAMTVWNNVPSNRIRLSRGARSETSAAEAYASNAEDPPLIICDPSFGSTLGIETDNIPGVGGVSLENGRINYGYLLLNSQIGQGADIQNLTSTTLRVVIAHEIGHVLGLGHSDDTEALMYYNAGYKEELRLSLDDVDGITYLYPKSEGFTDAFGCGTLSNIENDQGSSPPPAAGGGTLIGLLVLAWLATRAKTAP